MFYEQVKRLCDQNHIAISSLARKLSLSPSAPGNWKEGTLPKAETIIKISEYFDVSIDLLLLGKEHGNSGASLTVSGGSAVLNQSDGNTVSTMNQQGATDGGATGFESELVRIFRSLDIKGKSALLQAAYALEDGGQKG